jgi:DNA uptake protein ComE-like DNA-binding protein
MILNPEPVKNWFGHTRRERRSSALLLGIISVIICLRYIVPEQNISIENYGYLMPDSGISTGHSDGGFSSRIDRSSFIPDSASDPDDTKSSSSYKFRNNHVQPGSTSNKFPGSVADLPVQRKALLELNSCDSAALVDLPGIGPVLSVRIIKYRNLLGGFASVEQLREVYGLPVETYGLISGRLYVDTLLIRKIKINSAGFAQLSRIIYLENYEVRAILKYLELSGRIGSMDALLENRILSPEKAARVEPYLDFE